jgi:hypothetical protein
MSSDLRISYRPLDATPEAELEVLTRVYCFLIQSHENREAAASGGCVDNKGGESEQSKASSGSGGRSIRDRRGDGSDKPSKRTTEVITE